jgi:hypothetical protein
MSSRYAPNDDAATRKDARASQEADAGDDEGEPVHWSTCATASERNQRNSTDQAGTLTHCCQGWNQRFFPPKY